ncbi:MAG TPA: hypothetical protein VIB11_11940 [Pedococcus sp.]|jgi:hypothetical protein|uniref:hypothetical protein n=1 Tax=Pedococcus sp. TaxID=2860345 RepID=UPI002F954380
MEGTLRLIAWLERHAGTGGAAGALLLCAYWNSVARDLALPSLLGVPLQLAATLLFTLGIVGHQLEQGTHPSSWVGWGGAAAVGMGFAGSLLLACAGIILVGASMVSCGVHRATTGRVLMAGATALLLATTLAPGFGTDNSVPVGWGWLLVMNAGLVLIAGAMIDLAVAQKQEQHSTVHA